MTRKNILFKLLLLKHLPNLSATAHPDPVQVYVYRLGPIRQIVFPGRSGRPTYTSTIDGIIDTTKLLRRGLDRFIYRGLTGNIDFVCNGLHSWELRLDLPRSISCRG